MRPMEEQDSPTLFRWRNSERFIQLVSDRREPISYDSFLKELQRDMNRKSRFQLIIERKRDCLPIGTVYMFNFSQVDGYAFVNLYLEPDCERKGYGIEAFSHFVCYLFDELDLRKLYCEAFAYNRLSIDSLESLGAVEEGKFRAHRYFGGGYHDVIRFAIYKELVSTRLRKLAERFRPAMKQMSPLPN